MRIPPDAPVGVRTALQEVDQRLMELERRARSPEVTQRSMTEELDRLREEIRKALQEPASRVWEDVFGGPRAVSRGGFELVALDGKRILVTTDGAGTWPLPGLIPFNISPSGVVSGENGGASVEAPDVIPKYNILGSLFVQGALMASKITTDRFATMGYVNSNHPYCLLTHSANQQFGVGPVLGFLTFDTEAVNRGVIHSTAVNPTRITVPTAWPGLWAFWGHIRFEASATGLRRNVQVRKNGTTFIGLGECAVGGQTAVIDAVVFCVKRMIAGDYVEMAMGHDATPNLNALGGVADIDTPIFGGMWLCD